MSSHPQKTSSFTSTSIFLSTTFFTVIYLTSSIVHPQPLFVFFCPTFLEMKTRGPHLFLVLFNVFQANFYETFESSIQFSDPLCNQCVFSISFLVRTTPSDFNLPVDNGSVKNCKKLLIILELSRLSFLQFSILSGCYCKYFAVQTLLNNEFLPYSQANQNPEFPSTLNWHNSMKPILFSRRQWAQFTIKGKLKWAFFNSPTCKQKSAEETSSFQPQTEDNIDLKLT